MRVLFIHQAAELYGSDRVLLALVQKLTQAHGIQAVVVLPEHGPLMDEFERLGIEVHIGPVLKISRAMFSPMGLLKLVRDIRPTLAGIDRIVAGRTIDIVHSNTIAVLAGAIWSRARRRKHLWHVHEIIERPKIVARGFALLTWMLSDWIACISRMTQNNLTKYITGIKDKSEIIWNGLTPPPGDFTEQRKLTRSKNNIPDDTTIISLVGRINAWKGHLLTLEAIDLLGADFLRKNRCEFWMIGSAPAGQDFYKKNLEEEIKRRKVEDLVLIKGFTSDVWPIWAATDVALVPSTEPEPFGMVAIEAMLCGAPVVGAAHGGLIDIIEDERSGILFTPRSAASLASKIEYLIRNPEVKKKIGVAGRNRVLQHFSLGAQAEGFYAAYQRLQTTCPPKS